MAAVPELALVRLHELQSHPPLLHVAEEKRQQVETDRLTAAHKQAMREQFSHGLYKGLPRRGDF